MPGGADSTGLEVVDLLACAFCIRRKMNIGADERTILTICGKGVFYEGDSEEFCVFGKFLAKMYIVAVRFSST